MTDDSPETPEPLPSYVIEGARSGRSKCKTCRRAIQKGVVRLGILVEGRYGPGYLWHHLTCAARRNLDRVEEAYETEAWNHAKEPPTNLPGIEKLRELRRQSEERREARKPIPYAEPAPSGRARCKHCQELIEKGSLRVVLGREVEFGGRVRVGPIHVHPKCVAAAMRAPDCGTEPEGFEAALRAHSVDLGPERLDALLAEIGDPTRNPETSS